MSSCCFCGVGELLVLVVAVLQGCLFFGLFLALVVVVVCDDTCISSSGFSVILLPLLGVSSWRLLFLFFSLHLVRSWVPVIRNGKIGNYWFWLQTVLITPRPRQHFCPRPWATVVVEQKVLGIFPYQWVLVMASRS